MDTLAAWLWNPFLSFLYLQIGLLLLILTRFAAWRRLGAGLWRGTQASSGGPQHERHLGQGRAFLTALAATVGVGNWAGVSTAIHLGGPGALFWIWVSALAGMSMRMCSTWLAMRYQPEDHDSPLFATPMGYLERFMDQGRSWIPLAIAGQMLLLGLFSALIQSNSVAHAVEDQVGGSHLLVGLLLATGVAVVVLGGLRKIAEVSSVIVPLMVLLYLLAGLTILLSDLTATGAALAEVWHYAFQPYALGGGLAGYTVMQALQFGLSRGIFSHSSGLGTAPFTLASNTGDRRQNALLAAQVPVVDTLIICTVTGLVVLTQGDWQNLNGAYLTVQSFSAHFGEIGRLLLLGVLIFFAYTTVITWSYFAERCFNYLGFHQINRFRWLLIACVFIGPFFPVKLIWSTGDLLNGLILLLHLLPLLWLVIQHQDEIGPNLLGGRNR
ncbi:MAG: amino acid carrier protein [Gammaproteobacteria bacterium SHHR-1]|uniref:alanine/glycine:cation symporter family protein n=1 Tax=Magnetovirga frankeli TaxID=947516 RepID=UPI001AF75DD9|nr:sodium:alanine symporter family protein [gamma proteobacterium SS-5]